MAHDFTDFTLSRVYGGYSVSTDFTYLYERDEDQAKCPPQRLRIEAPPGLSW